MNLHNQIMNIQIDEKTVWHKYGTDGSYAYKEGHRDARHAAAELSLKADARIDELEYSLHWILTGFKNVLESKPVRDADEIICHIEKLLEGK